MTHKESAQKDSQFHLACEKAGIEPTKRQASKYRNQKGKAYKARKGVVNV
jgi:hypothetical protein